MTSELALDARSVSVEYRGSNATRALDALDVQLTRGEWRGVLGESGSGKSTFAMALLGLLANASVSGTARFGDIDLLALQEPQWQKVRWREVALAFQATTSLNPALRIDVQVAEPISIHLGLPKRESHLKAAALLERVGLPRPKHRSYPSELSTGQKRLVLLATTLACDPTLLILDEPTAGLDPLTRSHVLELLNDLRAERPSMTVLLMGHDIDALVATRVDSVQVLYMGTCMELGSRSEVLLDPSHPYTRGLLNANATMRTIKDLRAIRGSSPAAGTMTAGCKFAERCTQAIAQCKEIAPNLVPVPAPASAGDLVPVPAPASAGDLQPESHQALGPAGANAPSSDRPCGFAHAVSCLRGGIVTVLEAKELSQSYRHGLVDRVPVLRQIDLVLRSGEVLGLVGMTGAGKTTLSLTLSGLIRPEKGRVLVNGIDLSSLHGSALAAARQQVQMVFQDPFESISERFTVEEAVREPLDIAGSGSRSDRVEQVCEALRLVNMTPNSALLNRRTHTLSGGQLQRVAMARALVVRPKVLLADEPVAMLDPSEQARMLQLLKHLQVMNGLAMIFISHSLPLVMRVADRVAVLANGRIVELASAEELLSQPRSAQTATLLRAAGWNFAHSAERDPLGPETVPGISGKSCSNPGPSRIDQVGQSIPLPAAHHLNLSPRGRDEATYLVKDKDKDKENLYD